jgi:hypothetical protein
MFEHVSHASPFFFAAGILGVGTLLAGRLPSGRPAAQAKEGPVLN